MMMMTKVLLNPSRRFSATLSSLSRYLCTAATVTVTAEQAVTTDKGKKVKKTDALYNQLTASKLTGNSTWTQLNIYFKEENLGIKSELDNCIRQLRKNGRFQQALKVMEWMHTKSIEFGPIDHAKELGLISKVKGIHAAENYFNALPESAKDKSTYGALLYCYCRDKLTDKAQALFEKMDKMQFVCSVAFNNLLSLYMTLNLPDKVPPLVQEMKNRNIPLNALTYNIWITSYSRLQDIDGVEKVFEEMRLTNEEVQYEWTTYSNLAVAYVKAGQYEKAESILKILEEEIGKMGNRCQREPFHYLISLYAGTSNLAQVHSIWKRLKSTFKSTSNQSTLTMLIALTKLDDVNGFKKIFDEWESTTTIYDKRLPYHAIRFYQTHGMIDEAEDVFRNILKRYEGNSVWFWKKVMSYYMDKDQIDFALRYLEAAIPVLKNNEWHPTPKDVKRFMEYFKKQSDVDNAEKFCKILKNISHLDSEAYKLLLETYVASGKTAADMRQRIINDEIMISSELEELLGRVCTE